MTAKLQCPQCKAVHAIRPEMAGTKAKCRCGAVLTIPGQRPATGASAAAKKVPAKAAASGVSSLLEEWEQQQEQKQKEKSKQTELNAAERNKELSHGDMLSLVISRLAAGYEKAEIVEELVKKGIPDTEAARVVENMIPPTGYVASGSAGYMHMALGVAILGGAIAYVLFDAQISEWLGGSYMIIPIGIAVLGVAELGYGISFLVRGNK